MLSEVFNWEKIYGACEKVCYFLALNVLFLVSNLPALLFFLFVGAAQLRECLPLFLLCMLSVPPSLSAVFYAMNRLIRGTETKAFRDFKKGYRSDFFQKLKLGACHLFLIFIFWNNIEFFTKQFAFLPLAIVFIVLFAFSIIIAPTLYLLASRYQMKNPDIVRTAVILTITRPVLTLGNVAAAGILLMLFEISAGTCVLFAGSAYGFLITFMNRGMLKKLED